MDGKLHNEGEVYKTLNVSGREFVIRYGYYSEIERDSGQPIPVMLDFISEPLYTSHGLPFVTRIQDACEHYIAKCGRGDGWCADCKYYSDAREDIGVCLCEKRKISNDR